jgi:DNA mismatch repair protein MSH5
LPAPTNGEQGVWQISEHLQVDITTLYSLQVLSEDDHPGMLSAGNSKEGLSVLSILDNTKSPLGRKLLRTWILRPLLKEEDLSMRSEGIRFFASSSNLNFVGVLGKYLRQVKDVPRMMLRLRMATASVMDWQNLTSSFLALDQIR